MAVESDATVQLKVEQMEDAKFSNYIITRQSAVAGLSHSISDYASKRQLLELAINVEKNAAENLRAISVMTVGDGAANANFTQARKTAMQQKYRQVILFTPILCLTLSTRICSLPASCSSTSRLWSTTPSVSPTTCWAQDQLTT